LADSRQVAQQHGRRRIQARSIGLIFLKYISDAFDDRYQQLVAEQNETGADPEDMASFYHLKFERRNEYMDFLDIVKLRQSKWAFAESEFEKYRIIQDKNYVSDCDRLVEQAKE
jgi:type I restriction-modification system DNA methylase subunit